MKSRKGFSQNRNPTRKKTPLKLQSGRFKLLRTRIMDGPSCPVRRNTKRGREHEVSLESSNKKKQQVPDKSKTKKTKKQAKAGNSIGEQSNATDEPGHGAGEDFIGCLDGS
ncbi:hypothetical protein L6452_38958 [Arctium lappa]|uniref:Uncharacterized protein n=1 Tax=Arctium lappa TaxID=4217 RepID=A0ACB8XV33_ARCLA|nr:hypothetical protein L6452_38958 [Arctium lappa]